MFNLMRAELYRFKNSGGYLIFMIAASILGLSLLFVNEGIHTKFEFALMLANTAQLSYNMVLLTCGTLLTIFIGVSYNNRMCYYELMSGNSPHRIILSKVLSTGIISALIMYIPTAAVLLAAYIHSGKGQIDNPMMVFLILFIITLHTTISFILYTMLGRNLVIASFIPYIRL